MGYSSIDDIVTDLRATLNSEEWDQLETLIEDAESNLDALPRDDDDAYYGGRLIDIANEAEQLGTQLVSEGSRLYTLAHDQSEVTQTSATMEQYINSIYDAWMQTERAVNRLKELKAHGRTLRNSPNHARTARQATDRLAEAEDAYTKATEALRDAINNPPSQTTVKEEFQRERADRTADQLDDLDPDI